MPYEQFVYEVNCKGENVLVKSLNSDTPVTVRFTNQTSRPVNVWWRNFEGRQVFYGRIEPGASLDQGTFLTHPWQFTDACTEQYYVINNKAVFRPPPELACQTANFNITQPSCCAHTCFSFCHDAPQSVYPVYQKMC
ncbi:von Hippel-Lindau disease tumor suppressor-like [Spodoptera frugiperda]|uniref:von Hippel-Lindau disease tumor suppressor-like n=1 Tax=Spodoptera frugiperda TaxID=7108 RepID=A0A9R0EVA5_SPOFR|nr:von Hippel-Lindau disease tumor suppressor-like [Spodoptera frugiperda]